MIAQVVVNPTTTTVPPKIDS